MKLVAVDDGPGHSCWWYLVRASRSVHALAGGSFAIQGLVRRALQKMFQFCRLSPAKIEVLNLVAS